MNFLDMKTVVFSYTVSNAICALVMTLLWLQHRRRFEGLGFWLADFVMQFVAMILVALRDIVPDFVSMTVSNALIIGGTMFLLTGLERFWGKRRPQLHNAILLAIFIFTHAYFVFIYPSLTARNIIFSLGLLVICLQCAWFMLRGVDVDMRRHTRNVGNLFVAYCLVSVVRILVDVVVPVGGDFFRSNAYDTLAVMSYQMFFIGLTFSLILMVNRRLVVDLELDITVRQHADETFKIRLKLFELSSSLSLEDLMQKALDEIGPIVNSPIGFYHFVESDQKTLSLQAWSTRTLKEFCKAEGSGLHYPVDQAGVWTDCIIERKPVIHNDYPSLPHRKGLPPGHAEVIRELVVPILRNGQVVSILGVGNKPSNYDEKDAQFVSYIADVIWEIVERKRADEKLQQLSRAVEQSSASIVITDTTGRIEYVNPRFTAITGYGSDEVIGKNPRILKTDKTPRETHRQLWQELTSGREWQGEFINRKKNGEEYYESANISPIMNDQGIVTHYLAVKEDITGQKMTEKELRNKNQILQFQLETIEKLQADLREQAIRDPLTGLYNRRYLYETMGRELARAKRENYPISFMMMDIDHFKQVNDTHGHSAGDQVLVALADLLRTHTRQGDIACRYGGEEFLVIMAEVGEVDAKRRAEEICSNFNNLQIDYSGIKLSAAISIGAAFYPRDGNDSDMVIKAADAAMYKAKQDGRNRVRVWEADHQPAKSRNAS